MKILPVLLFIIQCIVYLLIVAWHVLAFLMEVLVNDGESAAETIGNHMTVGDNAVGDNADFIKRAGNHYISDRDTAIYDRINRH